MIRPSDRRRGGHLALVLTGLAALVLVWQNWNLIRADGDQRHVSFERWKRLTAYSAGYAMPGTPDLSRLEERLSADGLALGSPVFIRIFKREFELEVWLLKDKRFSLFATYPVCRWSGRLGPKIRQGDRQAPEGVYVVGASSLNPKSRWHRSFNLGFPNSFDRAHNRTGSFLMVHGGCSSVGCYAMTNPVIDEIWKLVTAAIERGQARIQVQVFPFRMTEENLSDRRSSPHAQFWADLKRGYDAFESERLPPRVAVCARRYQFQRARDAAEGASPIGVKCFQAKSTG
jgi:murein L,D-transpeptidase YafK